MANLPVVKTAKENKIPVTSTDEHQDHNPGTSQAEDNPGQAKDVVTQQELAAEMKHLRQVMELRRQQDRTLMDLFEGSITGLDKRFDKMEAALVEIGQTCKLREGEMSGYTQLLDQLVGRVETNEDKIGELKEGYASLKAWILIVGGITGIASAIAIIFK